MKLPCACLSAYRETEPGRAPDLTDAGLAMLEDQIRDSLRARRSVYEDSKTLLLKMFK